MQEESNAAPVIRRLTILQMLSIGMLSGGYAAMQSNWGQLITNSVNSLIVASSALTVGLLMLVPRLAEAAAPILVAYISDNRRQGQGRRMPLIRNLGLLGLIAFVAIWWVPGIFSKMLLVCVIAIATGGVQVMAGALQLEISTDYRERTKVFAIASLGNGLIAWLAPMLLGLGIGQAANASQVPPEQMTYSALVAALVFAGILLWCTRTVPEPQFPAVSRQPRISFWRHLALVLKHARMWQLAIISGLLSFGFSVTAMLTYYLNFHNLFAGDAQKAMGTIGIFGSAWSISGLLAIIPLLFFAKFLDKRQLMLGSMLLMTIGLLIRFFCYQPAMPYLQLLPLVLISVGMVCFYLVGTSILADLCDEDDLRHDRRAEAMHYWAYFLPIKLTAGIASIAVAWILGIVAYDAEMPADQLAAALTKMKWLELIVPLIGITLAGFVLVKFRHSQSASCEVRRQIDERNQLRES